MSRAINVAYSEAEVVAACRRQSVAISAIETLTSGGTRVDFMNPDATAKMKSTFGKRVIDGPVSRAPLRSWPR